MAEDDPTQQQALLGGIGDGSQQGLLSAPRAFQPGLDPDDPLVWHGPEYQPPPRRPSQAPGLIAPPPEGFTSSKQAYADAGLGNSWITGNYVENPAAQAHTNSAPEMPYGIDPFSDIVYNDPTAAGAPNTSGFTLAGTGQDLFGGRKWNTENFPSDIPELLPNEYQAWLAPALMRYFYNNNYRSQRGSGVNAPWTQKYAPTIGSPLEHPTWPGIAVYDPWHRDLGSYANLYS